MLPGISSKERLKKYLKKSGKMDENNPHGQQESTKNIHNSNQNVSSFISSQTCTVISDQRQYLSCFVCKQFFMNKSALDTHMLGHSKVYTCNLCVLYFESDSEREQHIQIHTELRQNVCNICKCSIQGSLSDLMVHMSDHVTSNEQVNCNFCSAQFSNNSHLKMHMVTHADENQYKCKECSLFFTQKIHFMSHMNLHIELLFNVYPNLSNEDDAFDYEFFDQYGDDIDGENVFEGTENPFIDEKNDNNNYEVDLKQKSVLSKEKKRIEENSQTKKYSSEDFETKKCNSEKSKTKKCNSEKSETKKCTSTEGDHMYKCDQCCRSFARRCFLVNHLKVHNGEASLNCYQCSHVSADLAELRRHRRTHSRGTPYTCPICQKQYKLKPSLNSHMLRHTGKKPHSCDVCGKAFYKINALHIHERIHTAEACRSTLCHFCQQRFRQKGELSVHIIQNHLGRKLFSCRVCGRSFAQKIDLKSHKRSHLTEKSFHCTFCSKTFRHKSNMVTHIRTHLGEKPYKCGQCSESFTKKEELTQHLHVHTREKLFICKICVRSFSQRETLNIHMRIHDGRKPFSCQICSKTFSLRGTLRTHIQVHRQKKEKVKDDFLKERLLPGGSSAVLIEQDHLKSTLSSVNSDQSQKTTASTENNSQSLNRANFSVKPMPVSKLFKHSSLHLKKDEEVQKSQIYMYKKSNVLNVSLKKP